MVLKGKFGFDMSEETRPKEEVDRFYNMVKEPQGVKNPDQVTPGGTWDREKTLSSLESSRDKMLKGVRGKTPRELSARGMTHAIKGDINLLEWLWVLTLHENSHLQAMEKKFQHVD